MSSSESIVSPNTAYKRFHTRMATLNRGNRTPRGGKKGTGAEKNNHDDDHISLVESFLENVNSSIFQKFENYLSTRDPLYTHFLYFLIEVSLFKNSFAETNRTELDTKALSIAKTFLFKRERRRSMGFR